MEMEGLSPLVQVPLTTVLRLLATCQSSNQPQSAVLLASSGIHIFFGCFWLCKRSRRDLDNKKFLVIPIKQLFFCNGRFSFHQLHYLSFLRYLSNFKCTLGSEELLQTLMPAVHSRRVHLTRVLGELPETRLGECDSLHSCRELSILVCDTRQQPGETRDLWLVLTDR